MGWASGIYSRIFGSGGWQADKAALIKILASRHDSHDQDVADGLNTLRTELRGEALLNTTKVLTSVAGTNSITASMTSATPAGTLTGYAAGLSVVIIPVNTNTGATTLNINSLGVLDVFNQHGSPCTGGELIAGVPRQLLLDAGADDWVITGSSLFDNAAIDTGSANAVLVAIPHLSTTPTAFTRLVFKANATNTGATTLALNAGSPIAIVWQNVASISASCILQGGIYEVVFDGSVWQLQGPTLNPLNVRTAAEISGGFSPSSYVYVPGHELRFAANTTPGTTNMAPAIQAAMDSATNLATSVLLTQDSGISTALLVRSTSQQNMTLVGEGRVSTVLRPLAANLSAAPVSINAMIINQSNNGHLHLSKFRILDSAAYVGVFLYSLEGGGANASAQCLFSSVVDDCWFSLSSNNTGIFWGGLSNLRVSKCVFEGTKDACFILQGVGNSDQQYIGNVMNFCYDSFIRQVDDGNGVFDITVNALHVYQHLRGRIIDLTQAVNCIFQSIIAEFDAANVGNCATARLMDCANVTFTECIQTVSSGSAKGAFGFQIVGTNSGIRIQNCQINADIGLQTHTAGVMDIYISDTDFTACRYGWQHLTGASTGRIRFENCRFSNATEYCVLFSVAGAMRVEFHGCEFINAGLGGAATSRNVQVNTTGQIRFYRCRIGRDTGGAAAAYFLLLNGSADVKIFDTEWVGTAPTGIVDPASTATNIQFITERLADPAGNKTFQVAAATNAKLVADTDVTATCMVDITPTNVAAGTVMGSTKSLYLSARVPGVSFTVTTADGTNVAGNSNFVYRINP